MYEDSSVLVAKAPKTYVRLLVRCIPLRPHGKVKRAYAGFTGQIVAFHFFDAGEGY